jgi:hypothetical protein
MAPLAVVNKLFSYLNQFRLKVTNRFSSFHKRMPANFRVTIIANNQSNQTFNQ